MSRVDNQRHYGVTLFSKIIYACCLLKISFFLGLPFGPPLAITITIVLGK